MTERQILVTAALPYVNGHIHIGHLVEYIQADVWVRFQRLRGHQVAYICADDTHGTATMIRARQEGRSEQQIMAEMSTAHQADFAAFGIEFTHYGSTDSASNQVLVAEIWKALRAAKDGSGTAIVAERDVTQLYDAKVGSFLADRFVKGTCPKCATPDQYGDSCEKCGSTYSPGDLKNAVSTLSGTTPEVRSARHYFVRLEPFRDFLKAWTRSGALQTEIANWLHGAFLAEELRDWDVSRPAPYFGFEIPDAPGNYFYVWVDAPVGYLASLTDAVATGTLPGPVARWWPKRHDPAFSDGAVEIHHFIGKDITYFHTLFWPAMLQTAGWKLPTKVHVHGFLTVDGEKMSKSKGTFVRARTYLEQIGEPAYLRYYFASKLNGKVEDIDLNLAEFTAKVNSDLVGKVVNLASRTARFVPALTAAYPDDGGLFAAGAAAADDIAAAYEACDYGDAARRIMALADKANAYVEAHAPWALKKDPAKAVELAAACTISLNLFRQLAVYLAPILPDLARQAGELLGAPITAWRDAATPVVGRPIATFSHLLARLESAKVQAMITASQAEAPVPAATAPVATTAAPVASAAAEPFAGEPLAPTIAFEDFQKIDLRAALVVNAEEVPKAKKILKLTVSLGGSEQRTIFAGIKTAYPDPTVLIGRVIVVVANLAPRQMSFGLSEGMAVAAGPGDKDIFLLAPDSGAKAGQRVH
ncbi:MAG: methionine--tRNA ligase [Planctomycetes bacterium]|nr:methionine--tRNA ligase [Planctomycetota bacterium]